MDKSAQHSSIQKNTFISLTLSTILIALIVFIGLIVITSPLLAVSVIDGQFSAIGYLKALGGFFLYSLILSLIVLIISVNLSYLLKYWGRKVHAIPILVCALSFIALIIKIVGGVSEDIFANIFSINGLAFVTSILLIIFWFSHVFVLNFVTKIKSLFNI